MNQFLKHAFLMFFLSAIPLAAADFHLLPGDDDSPKSQPLLLGEVAVDTGDHAGSGGGSGEAGAVASARDGEERLGFFEKRRRAKALQEAEKAKRKAAYHFQYDPIKNLIEDLKLPEKRDPASDSLLDYMNNRELSMISRIDIAACLQMEPPTKHASLACSFGRDEASNFWLQSFLLDETKFMDNKEFYTQSFLYGPTLRQDLNAEQRVRFYNLLHAELSNHW